MVLYFVIYATIMLAVGAYSHYKNQGNDEAFLVAERKQGWFSGGLSIAATWIWAPALFVSSQKAYEAGLIGFFWFFVPNVLTILFFGYVATKHLRKETKGYTLPGYMRKVYGEKTHKLYLVQFTVLQVMSMGVQLLAGGSIISIVTGWSYPAVLIYLVLIAFVYSSMGGIKASITTDAIQMIFMIVAGFIAVFIILSKVGFNPMIAGLGGIHDTGRVLFGKEFFMAMLVYGITSTIGLFAGPAGDQMFWQRVYSIDKKQTRKAFNFGAIAFAIIPLLFGFIGFTAAGMNFIPESNQMVNIEFIQKYSSVFISMLVTMLIVSGLGSTIDSIFCAISSLSEKDFNTVLGAKTISSKRNVSMLLVAGLGFIIAMVPGMQIFHLWLFYGTLRASTMMPTFITVLSKKSVNPKYMERGLLGSIGIGIPVYLAGSLMGVWQISLVGALLTVGISGLLAWEGTKVES